MIPNALMRNALDEARGIFEQGIALRPDQRRCYNGVAAVLTSTGALDEAERIFRESLSVDPEDAFARGGLDVLRERRAAQQ